MSTVVGQIEIQMMADIARLKSDMVEGRRAVETNTKAMGDAAKEAKRYIEEMAGALGVGFSAEKLIEFARDVGTAAMAAEKAQAQLSGALKATGFAAGQTREDIERLVQSLKSTTLYGEEPLTNAAAALLRFKDIQGETFNQALRLAPDLAAALGTDVVDAARQMGKAMEDPLHGLRGLKLAGVALTEQQIDLAKSLKDSGDRAGEQKIVLDALTASVGGQAAASNTGLTKATADAGKSWEELLKTIGQTGAYKNTVSDFQENASRRFKILADDIKALDHWWQKLGTHSSGLASTSTWQNMQKKAEEEKAKAGEERQRQQQAAEVEYANEKQHAQEVAAAAKQQQDAYQGVTKSLTEKIAAEQTALAGDGSATAVGKEYAKFLSDLTNGYLKLNPAQIAFAAGLWNTAQQLEAAGAANKDWLKFQADGQAANDAHLKSLTDEAAQLEQEVATYGMSKSAIEATTIARLEEARAIVIAHGATLDQLEALDAEIAARKRIQAATGQKEALDTNSKAAQAAAAEWKKFSDQIETSLTDALMRGFEGGKDAGKNFVDSLKRTLETAALKIAVQAIVSPIMQGVQGAIGGSPGIGGGAGGSGGGANSLLSAGSSLSNLFSNGAGGAYNTAYNGFASSSLGQSFGLSNAASFVGPLQPGASGVGLTSLGSSVGNYLPYAGAALQLLSGDTRGAAFTAAGAAIGSVVPVIGTAVGAVIGSLLGSLTGGGGEDPHNNADSRTIAAKLGLGGAMAPYNYASAFGSAGPTYVVSGQTSGRGRWADHPGLSAQDLAGLNGGVSSLFASGHSIASTLGIDPSVINDASVQSENFASAQDALSQLGDVIATKLVPNIRQFQISGQSLFQTLQTDIAAVKALRDQFEAFKNQIALGDLSTLDPLSKYRLAKDLYNQALKGSDANAVAQTAQQFLQASRTAFASSANYATDYSSVMSSVTKFENTALKYPWQVAAAPAAAADTSHAAANVAVSQAGFSALITQGIAQGQSLQQILAALALNATNPNLRATG